MVREVEASAHHERWDGARHEHFTAARQRRHAGTDVDAYAYKVPISVLDLRPPRDACAAPD